MVDLPRLVSKTCMLTDLNHSKKKTCIIVVLAVEELSMKNPSVYVNIRARSLAYSFSKPKALKEIYKSCLEQLDHLN